MSIPKRLLTAATGGRRILGGLFTAARGGRYFFGGLFTRDIVPYFVLVVSLRVPVISHRVLSVSQSVMGRPVSRLAAPRQHTQTFDR